MKIREKMIKNKLKLPKIDIHTVDSDQPYLALASGIVIQAARDAKRCYKLLQTNSSNSDAIDMLTELQEFFSSTWYATLCDFDGSKLLRRIKDAVEV